MKRVLAGLVLAAALLIPASAAGSTEDVVTAQAKRGLDNARISFTAVKLDGKVEKIKDFKYRSVPAICDEGTLQLKGGPFGPFKVRNKEFGRSVPTQGDGGTGTFTLDGRVIRNGKRFRGTIRQVGDFPNEGFNNCDTGVIEWRAT